MRFDRRRFLRIMGASAGWLALCGGGAGASSSSAARKPNVILCMADDLGWGDTGYNGHAELKTPNLDAMAAEGLRFERFYAGAPVCSPTRGSALTARHPYRYGVFFANVGHLPAQEWTLAEALRTQGYRTGHFGKWHLGTLTTAIKDSNRGAPGKTEDYSPPWEHGFDVCFSTEAKVPTYDPMKAPGEDGPYGTYYWKEDGTRETENLQGDDSRVIMDRVIPFVREAVQSSRPFFAVVWFHTPHIPVLAGPEHRAMYRHLPEDEQNYYGAVTAMDEQIGRLRGELAALGAAADTMLFFCSDNGPEGQAGKAPGSAGALRGRKRSLFEGGIRVPGLLVWPERVRQPLVTRVPCSTLDYFPTVMDVLGFGMQGGPDPVDGISFLPVIEGRTTERPAPIAFESNRQLALVDNRYKLYSANEGRTCALFDLVEDATETRDIAADKPDIVERMKQTLLAWRRSCKESLAGKDYHQHVAG